MHTGAVELPSFSIYRLVSKYVCAYTQTDNSRSIRLSYFKKSVFSIYTFFLMISFMQADMLYYD